MTIYEYTNHHVPSAPPAAKPETNRLFPILALCFSSLAIILSFINGLGILLAFPGLVFAALSLASKKGRVMTIIALPLAGLAILISIVVMLVTYFSPTTATQMEQTYYEETSLDSIYLMRDIDTFLLDPSYSTLDDLSISLESIKDLSAPSGHETTKAILDVYLDDIKISAETIRKNKDSLYIEAKNINDYQDSIMQLLNEEMKNIDLEKEATSIFSNVYYMEEERLITYIDHFMAITDGNDTNKLNELESTVFLIDAAGLSYYFPTDNMGYTISPFDNIIEGYKELDLASKIKDFSLKEEASQEILEGIKQLEFLRAELEQNL